MQAMRERGSKMAAKRATIVALAAVAAALMLVPGTATATVYCVDATPGNLSDNWSVDPSCKTLSSTIPVALAAAETSPEPDSVLIGPGNYSLPTGVAPSFQQVHYSSSGGNTLQLRGAGADQTKLTMGSTAGVQTGLRISAPAGSSVSRFALRIPANVDSNQDI